MLTFQLRHRLCFLMQCYSVVHSVVVIPWIWSLYICAPRNYIRGFEPDTPRFKVNHATIELSRQITINFWHDLSIHHRWRLLAVVDWLSIITYDHDDSSCCWLPIIQGPLTLKENGNSWSSVWCPSVHIYVIRKIPVCLWVYIVSSLQNRKIPNYQTTEWHITLCSVFDIL